MQIQILGTGCAKCKALEESALEAVKNIETDCTVVKVTDLDEIMNMGVMMTPALAIDGEVKSAGKVLSPEKITEYIKENE
ncbi:MAG: thioredoxin family protein [Spirochaetales bacterium]|nr:thioredoxin family protein [Spirochaetales bacterium]